MDEKEIFRKILKKQMADGPIKEQLQALKIRPTYGNGILFQMVKRAAEGDLSAAKYVLGVVQEEERQTSLMKWLQMQQPLSSRDFLH